MILQNLSIKLVHSTQVISRRLQVPEDMNLHDLHQLIQTAMPWGNCHMYEFNYKSEDYWYEEEDEVAKYFGDEPAHQVTKQWSLSRFLQHTNAKSFHYVYDMGDNWDHLIKVGATVESKLGEIYPKLLAAKGVAPPEEIGGIYHYNWALVTLNEPEHELYEETVGWFSDDFDLNADVFPELKTKVDEFAQKYQKKLKNISQKKV